MGYQALLFSGDEKSTRIVSQILAELEFRVEACNEPFAAVKQLTGQHYDALLVDCDDEQNAALLFKTARNSSSNSNSLAVALVQGQGGIARAFRIGANLILTKPINVEQSKSTLRTAKGLLRKAELAKPAAATMPPILAAPFDLNEEPMAAASEEPATLAEPSAFTVGSVASASLEQQEEEFPQLGPAEAALMEAMPAPMPGQLSASATPLKQENETAKISAKPVPVEALASTASAAAPAKENRGTASSLQKEEEPFLDAASAGEKAEPDSRSVKASKKSGTAKVSEMPAKPSGNSRSLGIAALLVLAVAGAMYYAWPQLEPLLAEMPIAQKYLGLQPEQPAAPVRPAIQPATAGAPPATGAATATTEAQTAAAQTPAAQPDSGTASAASTAGATQISVTGAGDKSAAAAATVGPDGTVHIPADAAAALLVQKADPVYPALALQQKIEGTVQLQANIGKDGSTSNIKVLSGKPLLATAATAAVRQYKYKPYEMNGQPTEAQTEINVDFKLP